MSQQTSGGLLKLFLVAAPVIIIGGLAIVVVTLVNDRPDEGEAKAALQQPTPILPTLAREAAANVGVSPADLRALGFDILSPVVMPPDNPLNDAKIELGKLLFFDPRMSANSSISCASCHQPAQGWGEGLDINFGFTNTPHWRNSQTIINSAYLSKLFWGGEKLSLEAQAKSAWTGATAQNLDPDLAEERMRQIPEYVRLFTVAFGSTGPSFDDALRAVAAFEATINSTNVPFDRYLEGDTSALSESAIRGAELFVGQAGCSACHSGPLLTDESFHALGVPDNPKFAQEPLRQITLRFQNRARGVSEDVYRTVDTDLGLFYTTKQEIDIDKFRTPMLREVGQTGPYMHNGVFATLEEVVQFYNAGGGSSPNKSPLIQSLGLDDQEVADLVAFLESLTGDPIIVEQPDLPDYEVLP